MTDPRRAEGPPRAREAIQDNTRADTLRASLAQAPDTVPNHAEPIPTLAEMTPHGRTVALTYYESGAVATWPEAFEAGRRSVEAELADEWAALRAVIVPNSLRPGYAHLAELRDQPERANRQREILAERGVAS